MAAQGRGKEPTVIKKYANRRLYDTGRSSYVTLEDLCIMVKEGHDFVVYDAKSGEDLTRQVLTQIIVDQESRGQNMLPVGFLRQLISFYGDNIQPLVPNYLEQALDSFVSNQEQFREHINKSFEGMGMFPLPGLDEINRQNMAMFEKTMRAFTSPFGTPGTPGTAGAQNTASAAASGPSAAAGASPVQDSQAAEEKINELKKNIAEMEAYISELKKQTPA